MKSNGKSTTPIIAAHAKKKNGDKPAPPGEGTSNGTKRVSRASSKATDRVKCQVLERISDGIIAFDAEMNHIYVNERAGKILGHEPQELIGKNFLEIYPDLIGRPFVDACQRALQTQTVIPFDGYFAPSDTWLEARVYPSNDGLSILLREGKHLEETPRLAAYNIYDVSQFPEQNPNPVMRFTRKAELLYANPASAALLASWQGQTRHNLPVELQELLFVVSETGSNKEVELENNGKTYSCLMVPVQQSEYVNLYFSDITERKQAQESIHALIHQTITGITRTDLQGRFLFVNQSFCEMTGYSESELLGKETWDVNHPDDVAKNKRMFERMITEGEPYQLEKRIMRRNGSILWVTVGVSPLRDATGQIYNAVSVVVDITRRKRAEESLLDSARRTLYLASLSDVIRPLGSTSQIEAEVVRILAIHLKASRVTYAVIKPDGTAIVKSSYADGRAGLSGTFNIGKYIPKELLTKLRAGRTVTFSEVDHTSRSSDPPEASVEPASIRTQVVTPLLREGELVAALFVQQSQKRDWRNEEIHLIEETAERMQTAMERVRAEEALRRERELLERIFDTMPVMLSMYDPSTGLQRLNPQLRKLIGLEKESASPQELVELCYPDPEYRKEVIQRMSACQPNEWVDVKMQTRDGRTLDTTWSNIQFSNGTQVGLGIDITERKQAEEDIHRLNAELQSQLDETQALLNLLPTGVWIGNHDCSVITGNPAAYRMMGLPSGINASVTTTESEMPPSLRIFVNGEEVAPEDAPMQVVARSGKPLQNIEHEILFENGTRKSVYASIVPLFDTKGNVRKVIGAYTDFTERKQGERALVEYARQQSALYKLVDQLHRADTLTDIFAASLDALISALQCDRASILLFDETREMHFIAWRGLSEEYRKATDGHSPWKYGEENAVPIWYDDVNTSDLSDALKTVIAKEGIGSLAFIPLIYQDKLIGKFMVYFNRAHAFSEGEINLSLTIGRQLASGVDRKRAEERLRTSEDRLRLAVVAGKIGIWDIDLVHRDRTWSKEGKAIYGLAEDEFLDFERQLELTYPDDRAYVDQRVKAFRDQGTTKQLNLEHRVLHPDGSLHWVEVQGEAVYEEGPLPVRLIGTIVDITERKRTEEALRQSEERFAQFMQYLPGLAWIKDIHGRYVFVNAAAEKAFGTPRDELYGRTDMQVFAPEVAVEFMKNDEQALTAAKGVQMVETLEQGDGVVHYSLVTKFPIPGVDGKPALIGGTAFDITEQRQMENALRESEERYRAIVNQATAGIVRKDANGKLIFVNDAFCEMLGYTASELRDKTIWQFTREEDLEESRQLFDYLMAEGIPFRQEKRLIRSDGSTLWVTVSVSPVLDVMGRPESAVSVYVDVTERKQAENRLALLTEVSDLTRRLEDPVELMASVAGAVGSHFEAKRCLFNEIDIEHDREIVHRDYHDGVESVAGTHKLTDYSGITTQEMIEGKTVVNFDSRIDPRTAADYERSYVPNGERAYIAIPLLREDRWVASLWMSDDKPRQWNQDDVSLLQTIAERTWTATEKLRINAALRDSEERLRKLNAELEDRVQRRTAELQAANEFLRESEATSRLILESMPDAILIANEEGRIVYSNTQVQSLFGYAPQEVAGQPVETLIPERFRERHVEHREDYGANRKRRYMGLAMDMIGLRKDNSEFPVDVMLSPISNNTNWDVMITIRDNTEQKQAQHALRANEEKLRKLFQVLPIGISFLNNQGQITEMNSALTQILGLSKHELLEGKFRQRRYIRSDGTPMPSSEFASVRAHTEQKTISNVETGIVKENGETIWTSVNAAPVDVADVDVVVATIDITERKKAEEVLHKNRERLRILSRRLVEVQEEERRAIARELHDRVGQNLAALNLNLNILRSQLTSTVLLEVGQRLSDSVNLVNQILTITRNVMGDLRSDVLDDYGLEAALREYAEQFTVRTGVQVLFDKSAKPIPRMDPSIEMTLLRIAQEALTNVARHAQAKQAAVSVNADHEAVYMSVHDDGIGILSWQRANQPGSHGLRIMRERAEAFGGSLQVQSTYKKGTRIDVKIPLGNLSQSMVSREKRS